MLDLWPDLSVAAAVLVLVEQRLRAVALVVLARPRQHLREAVVRLWACYCLLFEFVQGQ